MPPIEMSPYILMMKNKIPFQDYLTFIAGVFIMVASFIAVVCLTYFANC